jgi:hypothetical protein
LTSSSLLQIVGHRGAVEELVIDESHSSVNITERVYAILDEYGSTTKVFSVTLDNASSNNKGIQTLAPELSSYVGTVDSDFVGTIDSLQPKLSVYVGTLSLHQRCACHIINLMVKSALDVIKHHLDDIRSTISF